MGRDSHTVHALRLDVAMDDAREVAFRDHCEHCAHDGGGAALAQVPLAHHAVEQLAAAAQAVAGASTPRPDCKNETISKR
jgi:hypothetical protein